MSSNTFLELGLTACVIIWMWYYSQNLNPSNLDRDYGEQLTDYEVFVLKVTEDIHSGAFRFDLLLAVHCGFLWLKVA